MIYKDENFKIKQVLRLLRKFNQRNSGLIKDNPLTNEENINIINRSYKSETDENIDAKNKINVKLYDRNSCIYTILKSE